MSVQYVATGVAGLDSTVYGPFRTDAEAVDWIHWHDAGESWTVTPLVRP